MGIFGLGTHKVQIFGFFWVLPLGTQEYWVPKIEIHLYNSLQTLPAQIHLPLSIEALLDCFWS